MRKLFTLLELLIVVAIIGILVTLLLPSLGKAREYAKLAVCMSQQSQLAKLAVLYSKENNSNLLPHRGNYKIGRGHETRYFYVSSSFSTRTNFGYLFPDEESIKNPLVFYCPSQTSPMFSFSTYDPFPRPTSTDGQWGNRVRISYNYNPERADNSRRAQFTSLLKLEPNALLLSDMFTQGLLFEGRNESVLGHYRINSFNATRGDGSVKGIKSKTLLKTIRTKNSDNMGELSRTVDEIKEYF